MKQVGIYGGTFAPVHLGHVYVARLLATLCDLDRLWIMPARKPPHKKLSGGDTPQDRLHMLRLAFPEAGEATSVLQISDYELTKEEPSYTALTLAHFAEEDTALTFFCGTDMFKSLSDWYQPERIFALATIAHMPRTDLTDEETAALSALTEEYQARFGARIKHLPIKPMPMSSTRVREAIQRGEELSGMLSPAVADYIQAHGLYRGRADEAEDRGVAPCGGGTDR